MRIVFSRFVGLATSRFRSGSDSQSSKQRQCNWAIWRVKTGRLRRSIYLLWATSIDNCDEAISINSSRGRFFAITELLPPLMLLNAIGCCLWLWMELRCYGSCRLLFASSLQGDEGPSRRRRRGCRKEEERLTLLSLGSKTLVRLNKPRGSHPARDSCLK